MPGIRFDAGSCNQRTCGEAVTISDFTVDRSRTAADNPPQYTPQLRRNIAPLLFTFIVVAALILGWQHRDEGHLTPERGVGYWLGIGGGSAMLLLLLYPLRKRLRFMRVFGSIPYWFRIHMVLGIIGPVLILFHANFKFGSTNSNIALISMLLVAGSGIVGRYLYGKIHVGLFGRKSNIAEIISDAHRFKLALGSELPLTDHIVQTLNAFDGEALKPIDGVFAGGLALLELGRKARRCRRQLMADARSILASEARSRGWSRRSRIRHLNDVRDHLNLFFAAVRKAAAFAVYERLFSLWHVLHLPLFFLLILTTVLHVIAVHTF